MATMIGQDVAVRGQPAAKRVRKSSIAASRAAAQSGAGREGRKARLVLRREAVQAVRSDFSVRFMESLVAV